MPSIQHPPCQQPRCPRPGGWYLFTPEGERLTACGEHVATVLTDHGAVRAVLEHASAVAARHPVSTR